MKILLLLLFLSITVNAQQATFQLLKVGDSSSIDSGAALEIKSTAKYFLAPRMTTTQKNAISSPTNGALVYDSTIGGFSGYAGGSWSSLGGSVAWGSITGTLSSQTDLNTALGLKAPLASPTFTGSVTTPLSSGIVSSASGVLGTTNLSGDVTSSGFSTTVGKINGTSLSGLSTGILKNTTSTGVPSIAIAADFPTLNQSTSGNAATATSATSATTATNANNGATVSTTTSASFFPLFAASSTNGNQPFNLGSGLTFNPSTNNLTTTTFTGALTGNATNITGTTNSTLTTLSALTSVGTIATGTWNATTVAAAHGGTGQISVIVAPAASTYAGWDANKNFSANALIPGFTTTATAAGTTTMTIASTGTNYWTGVTTQTVKLPTTSVVAGAEYLIFNQSSGVVSVQSSGANAITTLSANTGAVFRALIATPTSAANWDFQFVISIVGSSSGNVLTSTGATSAPTWQSAASSPTGSYASASFANGSSWTVTSTTFADLNNTGGNALTVRKSSGITLTAAASSLPGIVWTPPSSTAVYFVTVIFTTAPGGVDNEYFQITDGTTVIAQTSYNANANPEVTLMGVYAPANTSANTVKIQAAASALASTIQAEGILTTSVEWTVIRIF